eukprot:11458959-Alexandrium_andersonii.AAC.1
MCSRCFRNTDEARSTARSSFLDFGALSRMAATRIFVRRCRSCGGSPWRRRASAMAAAMGLRAPLCCRHAKCCVAAGH